MKERGEQRRRSSFEEIARSAQETLLRDGYLLPLVVAEGTQATATLQFVHLGETTDERAEQMYQAGLTLAVEAMVGILRQAFFVSEGWMSAIPTDESLAQIRSSQAPNRKEILIVFHMDVSSLEAKDQVQSWEMIRSGGGELIDLVELERTASVKSVLLDSFLAGYTFGLLRGLS